MDEGARALIERLFDAFNRRDADEIVALCDERMEFFAVTAEEAGHGNPYVGTDGLRAYLADVATVWEDLLITPTEVEQAGDAILVRGRVYLRSRALGIRDMPTAWIWELRQGRFIRGQVFIDPGEAVERFSRAARTGRLPDPDASKSMPRLR
ncbi:MAG TPA: nuclear transport factor 2 family protein [Solirubrobacterales bacterium]